MSRFLEKVKAGTKKFFSFQGLTKKIKEINYKNFNGFIFPYAIIAFLLIVLPLAILLIYSLIVKDSGSLIFRFSLKNWGILFTDHDYAAIFWQSILLATLTTIFSIIISLPLCYILKFTLKKTKNAWIFICTLPIWLNMLLRVLGLKAIINSLDPNLMGSLFVLVWGSTLLYLPFMLLSILNSMDKISPTLIDASEDCGASKTKTFFHIILPLSIPGVLNGIIFVFLPTITTLIIPEILGSGNQMNVGKIIENYFLAGGNILEAAGIGAVVMIFGFIIIFILKVLENHFKFNQNKKKRNTPNILVNNSLKNRKNQDEKKNL